MMKLEVNDTLYELEYTINSVCDLEELTGKTINKVAALPGYTGIRALLWCGLVENHPDMTIKKAGAVMHGILKTKSQSELLQMISEAIDQAGFLGAQGKQ